MATTTPAGTFSDRLTLARVDEETDVVQVHVQADRALVQSLLVDSQHGRTVATPMSVPAAEVYGDLLRSINTMLANRAQRLRRQIGWHQDDAALLLATINDRQACANRLQVELDDLNARVEKQRLLLDELHAEARQVQRSIADRRQCDALLKILNDEGYARFQRLQVQNNQLSMRRRQQQQQQDEHKVRSFRLYACIGLSAFLPHSRRTPSSMWPWIPCPRSHSHQCRRRMHFLLGMFVAVTRSPPALPPSHAASSTPPTRTSTGRR